jgi:DNA-binding response OmpR family regulator
MHTHSVANQGSSASSKQQVRVLVADDDAAMRNMVVAYLAEHSMHAVPVTGGTELIREVAAREPSLVILERHLGQEDGLDLLRDLRLCSGVPVIIATAHRRDEADRVVGLELGADDYITKPLALRELLARIRAVLRRSDSNQAAIRPERGRGRARFGVWQLDLRARRLTDANSQPVKLTKGECTLLIAFLAAPGRPLSREHLLHETRRHDDVFDRSIDVQVLRLRRKLETDPSAPRVIHAERGVGYVFTPAVEWL